MRLAELQFITERLAKLLTSAGLLLKAMGCFLKRLIFVSKP